MPVTTAAVSSPSAKFPNSWKAGLAVGALGTVVISGVFGGFLGYLAGIGSATATGEANSSVSQTVAVPTQPLVVSNADGIAGVAAAVSPSVVQMDVSSKDASQSGTGSGFVISKDGYILTNAHVAGIADNGGTIKVNFANGESVPGTLVGKTTDYDLAVVKVDKSNLPAIQWGDSEALQVGEMVVALGSPLGLQGTVTSGIVSAIDRPVTTGDAGDVSFLNAIQTDAAINPGNSGGPLVNSGGKVIGVNSAIATNNVSGTGEAGSIGLGFAIPAKTAQRVSGEIIKNGSSPTPIIGIQLDNTFTGTGAKIKDVTMSGPAQKAGMKSGDIITDISGKHIPDATALVVEVRDHAVGEPLEIKVNRDGATETFNLTLTASE